MDPNGISRDLLTPLQIVSMQGFEDLVEILCKTKGIEINLNTEDIGTALHAAAQSGHYKIVQSLLLKNANFRLTNELDKKTPKEVAEDPGIIKLL